MRARNTAALIDFAIASADAERTKRKKAPRWSPEEDEFLRSHLGILTEDEIGRRLGRSVTAVHLRWFRDLQLPAPSKAPDVISATKAARTLGIDSHKIAHWVDRGFIPGRLMAGKRKIRLIKRSDFRKWVMDPMNWMYFDIHQVKDRELKKALKRAARKWGDEWWPCAQVARHHDVTTNDVRRYVKLRKISGRQIEYSYQGRHTRMTWKLWFFLKSEATRKDLKFVRRKPRITGRR